MEKREKQTRAPQRVPKFLLWREVLMSYVGPAVMAGQGGFFSSNPELLLAAFTTIGGSSALLTFCWGLWLQSRPAGHWVHTRKRWVVVVSLIAMGVSFGLVAAAAVEILLNTVVTTQSAAWLHRVWFDFPLSATIGSFVVSFNWKNGR